MKALLTTAKLATVAFAIASYIIPATAAALPEYDRTVTYYDAPTGGSVVGVFIINCTGKTSMQGVQTPWFEETLIACDPLAGS